MTRVSVPIVTACVLAACLSAAGASAAPASWKAARDSTEFRLSMPRDWHVDPDAAWQEFSGDDPDTTPPAPMHIFSIVPDAALEPGSTLIGNSVYLAVLPQPPGRTACKASGFIASTPPDTSQDFDVDTPGYAHAVADDPSGDVRSETYSWRLPGTPCAGVQYGFSYYSDDAEQAKGMRAFDRAKLVMLLDEIRETVARDGE
jgi:hypothetical protein